MHTICNGDLDVQLLSHSLSNIILHYDFWCIRFGRPEVNKIMFMLILICAIKLQSNHSKNS